MSYVVALHEWSPPIPPGERNSHERGHFAARQACKEILPFVSNLVADGLRGNRQAGRSVHHAEGVAVSAWHQLLAVRGVYRHHSLAWRIPQTVRGHDCLRGNRVGRPRLTDVPGNALGV